MARRFLDDVRADIISGFADNTTGLITAAAMRQITRDMVDSSVDDEAGITAVATLPLTFTVPATFTPLNGALAGATLFDVTIGGDGEFLIPQATQGAIVTASTPGFTYVSEAVIQLEMANNAEIEMALGIGGLPGQFVTNIVGRGPGRAVGGFAKRYIAAAAASSSFQVLVRAPSGPEQVTLVEATLGLVIKPTNNP